MTVTQCSNTGYVLSGRAALVTGAAGGIGAVVVEELARHGVPVAATDRDAEALVALAGKLAGQGLAVHPFPADIADAAAVEAVVAAAEERLGPVDYLVNTAGVLRVGDAVSLADAEWNATFAVNVNGVFHTGKALAARMAERGRGAVVTVASNAATTPRAGMAAYCASKAAAAMYTKVLGIELARRGVRCNVVAPGSTRTPMLQALWDAGGGPQSSIEGDAEHFRLGIPLGKLAESADIAAAVLFLLSDQAGHITLHELTVDGGATLGR